MAVDFNRHRKISRNRQISKSDDKISELYLTVFIRYRNSTGQQRFGTSDQKYQGQTKNIRTIQNGTANILRLAVSH